MSDLPESVVQRQSGAWLPTPFAAGPFGGLHGGVIATCLLTAMADWSSGLFRPDRMGPQRFAAWPNAELSVHLARPGNEIDPSGWFGVSGASAWNAFAWGYTGATLRSPDKLLARSAQACILTPAESGT